MKKKVCLLLTTLVMTFCMVVLVYGDDYCNEYGKNKNVRWLKVSGVDFNDVDETRTLTGVTYSPVTNTLTLNNCNITVGVEVEFIDYMGDIPLNIVIKGNNTITGREENASYWPTFMNCGSYTEGKDSSVYVSGGGTLTLNKVYRITENHILEESKNSTTSIKNVTINAIGGGFYSHRGNLKIEDATVIIDNTSGKGNCGIDMGTSFDEYGGNVWIKNSSVEVKTQLYSTNYYETAFECRSLNVNGLNIYAGDSSAKWNANAKTLLGYEVKDSLTPTYPMKRSESYIGYVLITPEKKNLPDISTAKDTHTSTYIKGQKTATYFAVGYTGDKVCTVCGTVISRGSNIAKKKLGAPTVKAGKKKITVKYKKISGATGFQIRYKKAGGKWVTKKYKTNKNCSKVFKKLKKGKKYSVQVRVVKGSALSEWSKTKTVKVK